MAIRQHLDGHEWAVDGRAAAACAAWAARRPDSLAEDLEGMAAYFPHWVLAGTLAGRAARCPACQLPLVPADGAARCPACRQAGQAEGLMWLGVLPAIARPEPEFQPARARLAAAGFAEAAAGGEAYLLVPLQVALPDEWPSVEPRVRYAPRWLDACGLPRASGAHHLVGVGQACLYAYGEWQQAPVHEVLQQRVVNHLASLLKVAAGQDPHAAFIGRAHGGGWQDR